MVLDKMNTDRLQAWLQAVFNKLDHPPVYWNGGLVAGYGNGVTRFAFGDRGISNGKSVEVVSVAVATQSSDCHKLTFRTISVNG